VDSPEYLCPKCGARFRLVFPEVEAGEPQATAELECLACSAAGAVPLPRSIAEARAFWLEPQDG